MNCCSNQKCKKEIRNYYTCKKCGMNFCKNSCMTDHTFEAHSNSNIPAHPVIKPSALSKPVVRNSAKKSMFIKFGEFAKDIIDDSYYNFKNFEFVHDRKKSLGSGAFGDVYLAKNKIDGKYFAIKIMEKEKIIESGASLDVIYREISIHRRINHENIVKLYSHHEEEKFFYLVMDYVNGGSLFSYIKRSKGADEKNAFKFFIQACSAVNFLHENNLVHRDLKPENLLIDDKENLKLCDFGWCVDITGGSRVTFCGTYEYMAPEIVKEVPYDLGIDVWSLGILLYELTHGYSPFRAQNDNYDDYNEIFKNIIKYNFKIEKNLSEGCIDLIKRLLTAENKSRIKMKEIFTHPWVMGFEKQYKEEKIKAMSKTESINVSVLSSSTNMSTNANKLADSLIKECGLDDNKSKNYLELSEKNKVNQKNEVKSISEKIEEKLNGKFKETTKSFSNEPEKADLIDLNEIENKLNMSLSKNKEYLNTNKTEMAIEANRNRSITLNSQQTSSNINQLLVANNNKNEDLLFDQKRKNSKKSENNNNISNLSINNDLINLNSDNNLLNENLNNVSYNELNNLNSQLIKKINNNNFNFNQFNIDDINNTYDNFLQNNLSINKNDLKSLECFNLFDNDNENLDFENFNGNIHIGNVDEIDNLEYNSYEMNHQNKNKNASAVLKNFENPDNKFFDFVLNQVQKKNLDKKTKKIKNKKIDSLLNDVSSNLANSKIYHQDEEFNSNSLINHSLNIHFNDSKKQRKISKEENIWIDDMKSSKKNPNSILEKEFQNVKIFSNNERERKTDNFNLFDGNGEEDSLNDLSSYNKAVKCSRNSELINNSIRNTNKAKKLKEIENEKSKYGIRDLNEIVITESNIEEGKEKTPEDEENPKIKKKLVKKIIKIKKERSQIITPSGPEGREKSNISSNDIITINKGEKDKHNLREQLIKNNELNPRNREKSNIISNNSKLNKFNKTNVSSHEGQKKLKDSENEKDLDKKLNLEFLPKDLLYNDLNYNEATKNMLDSLQILEKAKKTKIQIESKQNKKIDQDDVWTKIGDFFNPFKCGKN